MVSGEIGKKIKGSTANYIIEPRIPACVVSYLALLQKRIFIIELLYI
jgi:hypothetical protein